MNIALFGYGKMGKMIEQVALDRHHAICARIDVDSGQIDYDRTDVAIDFSTPDAAFDNIKGCLEHGVPVISGTTGWLHRYQDAVDLCNREGGAFIYASNFSLGVNIFFELNRYLARLMNGQQQYRLSMEEIHHTQKLDAPSGTAITLAEDIIAEGDYKGWKAEEAGEGEIPIISRRINEVAGTHRVTYASDIDQLDIKHTAHNRQGFALGAVVAAEWIIGRSGVYTMKDVLDLGGKAF